MVEDLRIKGDNYISQKNVNCMKCQMCEVDLKKIIAIYYEKGNNLYVCDRCYGNLEEFVKRRQEIRRLMASNLHVDRVRERRVR